MDDSAPPPDDFQIPWKDLQSRVYAILYALAGDNGSDQVQRITQATIQAHALYEDVRARRSLKPQGLLLDDLCQS